MLCSAHATTQRRHVRGLPQRNHLCSFVHRNSTGIPTYSTVTHIRIHTYKHTYYLKRLTPTGHPQSASPGGARTYLYMYIRAYVQRVSRDVQPVCNTIIVVIMALWVFQTDLKGLLVVFWFTFCFYWFLPTLAPPKAAIWGFRGRAYVWLISGPVTSVLLFLIWTSWTCLGTGLLNSCASGYSVDMREPPHRFLAMCPCRPPNFPSPSCPRSQRWLRAWSFGSGSTCVGVGLDCL